MLMEFLNITVYTSVHKKQTNDQANKDKQQSTKHYTQKLKSSNSNPTKHLGWSQVLRKGKCIINSDLNDLR